MSLTGRLALQQSRARLLFRPAQLQGSVAARQTILRALSTSPRRLLAQHTSGHNHASPAPPSSNTDVNPYKGGPSAIDKAVHLFFFTEILRGLLPHHCHVKYGSG